MGSDVTSLRRPLGGLVKVALNLRLVALLLTVLWLPAADPAQLRLTTALLAVAGLTSVLPILAWDRLGGFVLAHPITMVPDLILAVAILALVGLDTPFGLFVVSTALAAGALYGWAGSVVMSVALLLAYVGGAMLGNALPTLAEVLGTPALIPLVAAGGAAVRDLLLRQSRTAAALAEAALNTAAASERTRLAREMHDTLAKTLHGIALSATALPELLRTDASRAAATAAGLAATAERAADEARALIVDLRQDDLERPLGEALEAAAATWSERTGVAVDVRVDPCEGLSPSIRYELFCIAREALRNAHEHGRATRVTVTLSDGPQVRFSLADDGRGFAVPAELADLADAGHFGIVGMRERAETVGGTLHVVGGPGRGTSVEVVVPRTAPGESEGQLRPPVLGSPEVTT